MLSKVSMVNTRDEPAKLRNKLCSTWLGLVGCTNFSSHIFLIYTLKAQSHCVDLHSLNIVCMAVWSTSAEDASSLKSSFTSFLWPFNYSRTKLMVTHVSVSGYEAVSGGNQHVDQSAWSVATVQGIGSQVPHGSQVWRPPSHWAIPQLQGKKRQESSRFKLTYSCLCVHQHPLRVICADQIVLNCGY